MRNKQDVHGASAIAEISCSGILLLSMYLPWVSLHFGGSGTFGFSADQSFSFFDGISKLSSMGGYASEFTSVPNPAVLLYVIPALCIINMIIQCFIRLPWLSFYTAIIPTAIAVLVCYKGSSYDSFGGITIGIGAIITIISGIVMILCAWASIGWYYKEHWIYLIIIASLLLFLILLYKFSDNEIPIVLCAILGFIHIPFMIYAGIFSLISYSTRKKRENEETDYSIPENTPAIAEKETERYMNSVRMRSNENLKEILENKRDYSSQLIQAAEKVLLERITTPPASATTAPDSASIPGSESAFDHKRYKAYQPSSSGEEEKDTVATEQQSTEERNTIPSSAEIPPPSPEPQKEATLKEYSETKKTGYTKLIAIIAGTAIIIGTLIYFFWYAPYAKERDTLRTYVIANSIFLRSSEESENEDNILDKVPYGSELITYEKDSIWAKVGINGQEGFVASPYLLTSEEFSLLDNAWGNDKAKECIESSKCRLAILHFYQMKQLASGPEGWQIYTQAKEEKTNNVFYPRIYDKESKFTDFVFIIKNIREGGKRIVACYSFDNETESPIYRFCTEAPQEGYIEKILPTNQGVTIVFDNATQIRIAL